MRAVQREQRAVLTAYGVSVEDERPGKGSHRVLYCRGPQGQQFVVTIQNGGWDVRAKKNFEADLKKRLTGPDCYPKVAPVAQQFKPSTHRRTK